MSDTVVADARGSETAGKRPSVRAIQAALFAFCLSVFLVTFNTRLGAVDAVIMYQTAESLAERRTFAIEHPLGVAGRDGRRYSKYGPLQPILAVPLYAAGAALSRVGPLRPRERHLKRAAVSLFNPLVTALLAAATLGLALRLGLSRRRALAAALLLAFGTPAWYYSKTFFSEPLTSLLLVLAFSQSLDFRRDGHSRHAWVAGLCAGLAVATRPFALVAAPVLLLALLPSERRRRAPAALRFCLPMAVVGALLAALNVARFGSPTEFGYGSEAFSTPLWLGLAGLLASPRCGLLFYSPALLLSIPGLKALARRQRREAWAVGALAAVWTLVISTWSCWWAGGSWGPRLLVPLFPFLAAAAVAALPPFERVSRGFLAAAALLAAANVGLQVTSLLVTNARWEYTVDSLSAREGGDGNWQFRYMPLRWQARFAREVLTTRTPVDAQAVGFREADPEASAPTPAGDALDAITARADMHVVDFWPALFTLFGLPARIVWAGLLFLLACVGASLAALLSRMRGAR